MSLAHVSYLSLVSSVTALIKSWTKTFAKPLHEIRSQELTDVLLSFSQCSDKLLHVVHNDVTVSCVSALISVARLVDHTYSVCKTDLRESSQFSKRAPKKLLDLDRHCFWTIKHRFAPAPSKHAAHTNKSVLKCWGLGRDSHERQTGRN